MGEVDGIALEQAALLAAECHALLPARTRGASDHTCVHLEAGRANKFGVKLSDVELGVAILRQFSALFKSPKVVFRGATNAMAADGANAAEIEPNEQGLPFAQLQRQRQQIQRSSAYE